MSTASTSQFSRGRQTLVTPVVTTIGSMPVFVTREMWQRVFGAATLEELSTTEESASLERAGLSVAEETPGSVPLDDGFSHKFSFPIRVSVLRII